MPEIFAPAGSLASDDPGGVSTCWSKGCRKILPKFFFGVGCSDGGYGSQEVL